MLKLILYLLVSWMCVSCVNVYESEEGLDMDRLGLEKNGWSASGTLIHRGLQEVSCQANFPDAKNYTAQFKVSGDLRNKKTIAEITWTVEGNPVRRVISVADGVSIQGAGQAVSIKIRDVSTQNLAPGWSNEYTATVTIAPGTRGSTSNPPILNGGLFVVADANTQDVPIPEGSGVISVSMMLGTGIPGTLIAQNSVMIAQVDSGGNLLARYDPRNYFWPPLLPGCSKVTIINNSGAGIIATVIFGIDG